MPYEHQTSKWSGSRAARAQHSAGNSFARTRQALVVSSKTLAARTQGAKRIAHRAQVADSCAGLGHLHGKTVAKRRKSPERRRIARNVPGCHAPERKPHAMLGGSDTYPAETDVPCEGILMALGSCGQYAVAVEPALGCPTDLRTVHWARHLAIPQGAQRH